MFSFHKPKVYRSSTGCCICKAKSSSSRFTDSRKYEQDFLQCFQLDTPRQGEICNACVLLVKRWKKLPAGSSRNWRHVVDARAGPGMKSMVKFKSKNKHLFEKANSDDETPTPIIRKKKLTEYQPASPEEIASSPEMEEPIEFSGSRIRKSGCVRRKHTSFNTLSTSSFLDMTFWKREYVCCGTVFVGPTGELLIDERFFSPCSSHTRSGTVAADGKVKSFSDSSSDSGYDECSNPGIERLTTLNADSKQLH